MKAIPSILFSFCLLLLLFSCEKDKKSLNHTPSAAPKTTSPKATVKTNELNDLQTLDWSVINDDVMGKCISPYLIKHRISVGCTPCRKLRLVYIFHINDTGQLLKMNKDYEAIECNLTKKQRKELDSLILNYLKKKKMPSSLYNTNFKMGLGFILKC
ncbi:hypothetical protein CEY12_00670 [Chryseobacterium sp. T16E-39]|uniref:hypothetical protein n=1 Tax=Chryseobacterium sp. T16E-39 TaxID=2015076 RepID=UPI000B5B2BD3|nr:hypothetical protein [Chryseobacterium sp. T16E-39]ASK28712.1 hypothetical protein CEY12_00670 [Chryseobacterium sp. T16E-39]